MPNLTDANSFFITLTIIIVNILVCLFLIQRHVDHTRQIARLKNELNKDSLDEVRKYFDRQFNETHRIDNSKPSSITHKAATLRKAYLKIEEQALNRIGHAEEFWSFLDKNLNRILLTLSPAERPESDSKETLLKSILITKKRIKDLKCKSGAANKEAITQKTYANLDAIYDKVKSAALSPTKAKLYQDRLNDIVQAYEQLHLRRNHIGKVAQHSHNSKKQSALSSLSLNCNDNSATINYAKSIHEGSADNKALMAKLESYQKENYRLQAYIERLKQTPDTDIDVLSNHNSTGESHEISEEIIRLNEEEIERLKTVIKRQKNTILELEDFFENNKNVDPDLLDQHELEVAQLKRSAVDAEMCIRTLEVELENLKTAKNAQNDADDALSLDSLTQLNEEISELKKEILKIEGLNQQYSSLLNFVFDAIQARSPEDVSLLLNESLIELNFLPVLFIKSQERLIQLSDDYNLSAKDRALLSSIQMDEVNPSQNGKLMFRLQNIHGILIPTQSNENPLEQHEHTIQITRFANMVINQIVSSNKGVASQRKLNESLSLVQQTSYDIDTLLEDFLKRIKHTVAYNLNLMKTTARTKGLSASQVASLQIIEQETLDELKAQEVIRPKLRMHLLNVIKAIEES